MKVTKKKKGDDEGEDRNGKPDEEMNIENIIGIIIDGDVRHRIVYDTMIRFQYSVYIFNHF